MIKKKTEAKSKWPASDNWNKVTVVYEDQTPKSHWNDHINGACCLLFAPDSCASKQEMVLVFVRGPDLTCLAAEDVKQSALICTALLLIHPQHACAHIFLDHGTSESYWETFFFFAVSVCWSPWIARAVIDFTHACQGNQLIQAWELHAIFVRFPTENRKGPQSIKCMEPCFSPVWVPLHHMLQTFTSHRKYRFFRF